MELNKTKKIILGIVLALVGAGVLTGGVYYTWLITPPGPPKTAADAIQTIGSARYARMPAYRKTAYMEQAQKLFIQMPEDQRRDLFRKMGDNEATRQAMGQAFQAMMAKQALDFGKASPADRIKMLDEAIDREEQMRQAWGRRQGGQGQPGGASARQGPPGGGPGGPGGPGGQGGRGGPGGRGGNFRARMQQMIEHGNPQQLGLMGEFRKAMAQRRAQRGLPAGRGPR